MGPKRVHTETPKYQKLFDSLKADILSGRYKPGQKMPSEAALVNRSGLSRITVGRAIRELQNVGLIDRVAGSGTYVRELTRRNAQPYLFGLLIPDMGETEIFGPICQAIANAPGSREHGLLWGHSDAQASKAQQAWRLCQQYIQRKVSGVFFAPLEFEVDARQVNQRILHALSRAGIAVVLLDRRATTGPERNRPDLVGINNRQAGYVATEHLIRLGCRHIGFLGYHGSPSTISERVAGYREALATHGLKPAIESSLEMDPGSPQSAIWTPKPKFSSLDAFVCVNDRVAGQLMQVFLATHVRIPQDIRLVGIDDVHYAALLPTPLTTVRQPTREIAEAALRTMLDRIDNPQLAPRELLLDGKLVIRRSCGATENGAV
jgi:DNA-binding LacI/PurR family transcriptional regulator